MDWVKPANAFVASWWAYIDFCLDADIQARVCRPFWTWVTIALIGIGGLVLLWVAVKLISYKLKLRAARNAEAERMAIADPDTMDSHRWKGDSAYQDHVSAEDVRRRIKEALVERRNEGKPPPLV